MKTITLEIGAVYGRLTVIGNAMRGRYSAAICRCACGTVKTIRRYSLTHGSNGKLTRSCGCLALEVARVALKVDRGSSFASSEAYAAHRKTWLKAYAKTYDARPEQRVLREQQAKARFARMTPEQQQRERELARVWAARPVNRERAKKSNAAYVARPEIAKKLKVRAKTYFASQRDNLTDGYVADCFIQNTRLKRSDLPAEVIAAVRVRLQIARQLKKSTE